MDILRIGASDTVDIRHRVLRPGKPREEAIFDGDEDEQAFHLGAFVEGRLVSVASFYFQKHPDLPEEFQYRLRGMATLDEYRHQGFSGALLKMAFPIIKQNLCTLVWCNARVSAEGFYQKVGFERFGEVFEIPDIGPHIVMYRRL